MSEPVPARPEAPEDWITTREAALLIGVTSDHVGLLIRRGTIQAHKFGPVWMVNRLSAEAYAKTERRTGPRSDQSSAD